MQSHGRILQALIDTLLVVHSFNKQSSWSLTQQINYSNYFWGVSVYFRTVLAKRTFCNDENVLYLCCQLHVAFEHLIMANVTEELNFLFYLIFTSVNLELKSHMCLISSILDSIRLNRLTGYSEVSKHYCTGSFSVRTKRLLK